ncbi:MAG: hypothetical protein R3F11_08495 [Verrucomicrobiales bacterium]
MLELVGQEGWTVVVSSHDIEEVARIADRVVFLHAAGVRLEEDTDSLLARFRSVEAALPEGAGAGQALPGDWLEPKQIARRSCGSSIRIFDAASTAQRLAEAIPGARLADATPMDLVEIFVALARRWRLPAEPGETADKMIAALRIAAPSRLARRRPPALVRPRVLAAGRLRHGRRYHDPGRGHGGRKLRLRRVSRPHQDRARVHPLRCLRADACGGLSGRAVPGGIVFEVAACQAATVALGKALFAAAFIVLPYFAAIAAQLGSRGVALPGIAAACAWALAFIAPGLLTAGAFAALFFRPAALTAGVIAGLVGIVFWDGIWRGMALPIGSFTAC